VNIRFRNAGFSLTEVMIAMALALVLLGGVIGVFISNQNTARTTTDLSNLQNSVRLTFQLMSQDIRSAGFIGCNNAPRVVSVIEVAGATPVWANWRGGVEGFAADADGNESIRLMYGTGVSSTVSAHAPPVFNLNSAPGVNAGDIALICDDTLSAIFQVSAIGAATLNHAAAAAGVLNCSADLGLGSPFVCSDVRPKVFQADSMVMRFESVRWFVAPSLRNNTMDALFRESLVGGQVVAEEVLAGVQSLNFAYQEGDRPFAPVAFGAGVNMLNVVAVNVSIVLDPAAFPNIQLGQQQRTIEFLASVRNRLR
jgi:type IV pilus assembly protein PilW